MSDEPERDSRTEEASPRRIEEARRKGNTPFSREVGGVAALLAIGCFLPIGASHMAHVLVPILSAFLDRPAEFNLDSGASAFALLRQVCASMAAAAWPLLVGMLVAGLLVSLQSAPSLVLERIKPDPAKISIKQGARRILGAHGRMELLKALLKICLAAAGCWLVLRSGIGRMVSTVTMRLEDLPGVLVAEIAWLHLAIGMSVIVVAAADLLWVHFKWQRDLRMSLRELKEEQRQAEGDPLVRARLRSLARDRARRRMMAQVPRATLVVANPSHYAVALRYVHQETDAPLVLAKGIDHVALRIRALAEEHGIPVIEDRALARSLYGAASADRPIPPEFYRAVAEIILHLMSKPRAGAR
jgi:flagellar biosynthetic protein FlhB